MKIGAMDTAKVLPPVSVCAVAPLATPAVLKNYTAIPAVQTMNLNWQAYQFGLWFVYSNPATFEHAILLVFAKFPLHSFWIMKEGKFRTMTFGSWITWIIIIFEKGHVISILIWDFQANFFPFCFKKHSVKSCDENIFVLQIIHKRCKRNRVIIFILNIVGSPTLVCFCKNESCSVPYLKLFTMVTPCCYTLCVLLIYYEHRIAYSTPLVNSLQN